MNESGDSDSDRMLEIVRAFDGLLVSSAPIEEILLTAAREAACLAGISPPEGGHRAVDAVGDWVLSRPDHRYGALLADGTEVWLSGSSLPRPLVELVVERLYVAANVWLHHAGEVRVSLDPSTAFEVALSAKVDAAERARALRLLRLSPTRKVVVAAYDGPVASDSDLLAALPDDLVLRAGRIGSRLALILTGPPPPDVPVPRRGRIGYGTADGGDELPAAWDQAMIALRFALRSPHGGPQRSFTEALMVDFADLGAWAIVAEHLPIEQLRLTEHPDVAALDRLLALPAGEEMRCTLETVAATGSIRQAAVVLHLHHNSVAHRVARAEAELGFQIAVPYGRSRLLVGLIMQRLRDNV